MKSDLAFFVATLGWMLPSSAGAQTRFVAVSADGSLPAAPLVEIAKDWSVRLGGDKPARIAAGELVELCAADHRLPPFPREHFLRLANGDLLPLQPGGGVTLDEDRLQVALAPPLQTPAGAALKISQAAAALLVGRPPDAADDALKTWADLQRRPLDHDLVLLASGERLEGGLTRIDRGLRLQLGKRKVDVPWNDVSALAFNDALQSRPRLKKPHVHVILKNGARITFATLRLDPETGLLRGVSSYGAALAFPLNELVYLEPRPGRFVYLSDLTPAAWKHTPFLDLVHPLGRDATLAGKPLEIGGAGYTKGLSMACGSTATYALGGAERWFEALVGIDSAGPKGRLRFRVLLDRKAIDAAAEERGAADEPMPLRIDVRGAKTLTLITEEDSRGNVHGVGIWANARLIR